MTEYQKGYEAALHEMQNILSMAYGVMEEKSRTASIAEKSYYMGILCAYTGVYNGVAALLRNLDKVESSRRPPEPSIN